MLAKKQIAEWDRLLEKHMDSAQEYPFEIGFFPRFPRFKNSLGLYNIEWGKSMFQELQKKIAAEITSKDNILTIRQESRDLHACSLIQGMINSLMPFTVDENKKCIEPLKQKIDQEISAYQKLTPWYKKIDWPYFWRLTSEADGIKRKQILSKHINLILRSEQKPAEQSRKFQWPSDTLNNMTAQNIEETFKKIDQLQPSRKLKNVVTDLQNFLTPYIEILKEVETYRTTASNQNTQASAAPQTATQQATEYTAKPVVKNEQETERTIKLSNVKDAKKIILATAHKIADGKPLTEYHLTRAYRTISLKYHPDKPDGDEEQFKFLGAAFDALKLSLEKGELSNEVTTPATQTESKELAQACDTQRKNLIAIWQEMNQVEAILNKYEESYHHYMNEKDSIPDYSRFSKCAEKIYGLNWFIFRVQNIHSKTNKQSEQLDKFFNLAKTNNDVTKDDFYQLQYENRKLFTRYLSLSKKRSDCCKMFTQAIEESRSKNESSATHKAPLWNTGKCQESPVAQNYNSSKTPGLVC